jgi:hypothetical protein
MVPQSDIKRSSGTKNKHYVPRKNIQGGQDIIRYNESHVAPLAPEDRFGPYILISPLGEGGMGEV